MDGRDIIRKPIVSEKSYVLIEENVYTFEVHPEATKPQIREAVEQIFGVRVTKVNTLNRKGKRKRNRTRRKQKRNVLKTKKKRKMQRQRRRKR
ncbi:MAG: 50S ribosomal protein L23 [Actinomycetota bacterium]|nr:50S ribosomal protein L23 [Actinomycetota bacterium]